MALTFLGWDFVAWGGGKLCGVSKKKTEFNRTAKESFQIQLNSTVPYGVPTEDINPQK